MTTTYNLLTPGSVAGTQFIGQSGKVYTSDANGVVKSVAIVDVLDMIREGCLMLGQANAKSNLNATTNPGTTNDSTQDYGIGSHWLNKTTGVEYVCSDATASAAVWNALNAAGYAGLPWVTGRFYGVPNTTPVALLTVASTLYAYPIFVPNAVTLAALQASVTTGQTGGKVEIGLYKDTGAGYPGAIVAGTDTGDLTATGTTLVGPTNLAVALQAGWYWAAVQAAATSTMPSLAAGTVSYLTTTGELLGSDTAAHNLATSAEAVGGISKSSVTYAALPATFPAGATLALNAGVPLVSLGV